MGVRFPLQEQGPVFGPIQQARDAQQTPNEQQETQEVAPGAARETRSAENDAAVGEAQEPQALQQQAPAERAAADAGAQTPGSIIDLLA